jgi:hypothetical protein
VGDFASARKAYERARDVQKTGGFVPQAAVTTRHLAALAIDEGRAKEAESLAREAIAALEEAPDERALAESVLARALFAEGNLAGAEAAAERARARGAESENVEVRMVTAEAWASVARLP